MVSGRYGLWLVVLACGCVQSTLGEAATDIGRDAATHDGGPDAAMHDGGRDAAMNDGGDAAMHEDASRDAQPDVYDAGCEPDTDQDGVCDRDDNCPDVDNPDQLDADNDGRGDACDPCTVVETIPDMASLSGGTVTKVIIGGGSNYAEVGPGDTIEVEVDYVLDSCVVGVPVALQVGFEAVGGSCLATGLCAPDVATSATGNFTAPTEPGLHYLRARMPQAVTFMCVPGMPMPWTTTTVSQARIAAVCVQPPR